MFKGLFNTIGTHMPKVNHFVNSVFNHSSRLPTTLGKHFGRGNARMGLAAVGGALTLGGGLYAASNVYKGVRNGSPTSYAKGIFGGGAIAALGMGLGHSSARGLMKHGLGSMKGLMGRTRASRFRPTRWGKR